MEAAKEKIDAIIISQSEIVRYGDYSRLPIERIDLFKDLVFLRMVYLNGKFMSHLDIINTVRSGMSFSDAKNDCERKSLYSIWNLPGLSGLLVANAAKHQGFNVKVINNFDSEYERFISLYDSQSEPPLVGISTTFHLSYAEIKRIIGKLRSHDKLMKIVTGGAFSNEQTISMSINDFEKPMKKYGIDYVLHAFNSDVDFPDLLRAHISGKGLDSVPNLAWLDKEENFFFNKKSWNNPTLDTLPMRWKELDLSFVNRTIQIRAASGCPFSCSFCSYPGTAGGHFAMDLEPFEKQLDDIKSLGFIDKIIFIDDTFNVPIRRFKEILKILKKFQFEWFSFLRVQYIDDEVAMMMKESGCVGVYLGIESANDTILQNMNKKVTKRKFIDGINLLKKYDITMFAAFVVGFPGETEDTIEENIRFLNELDIDFYSTKEFYYMHHTLIHENREKFCLSGIGNKWSHNTMNSETAAQMKIHMFRNVKNSIFIDPDTSLWYIAYLYDQGFSMTQIKECQQIINDMMLMDIDHQFNSKQDSLIKLSKIMSRAEKKSLVYAN